MKYIKNIFLTILLGTAITGSISPKYDTDSKKEVKTDKKYRKKKKQSSTKIADTKSEKRRYGKHSGPTAEKKNEKVITKHKELI